jgi:hypothetical protein
MNGWDLASTGTAAADAVLDLIVGNLDKSRFGQWLQANSKPRVSFELRDFFSLLTPDLLQSLRDGTVGGSDSELAASFEEAALAMPLIRNRVAIAQQCLERGDIKGQDSAVSHIVLLQLLFRAAEELGYEW